MALVNFNRVPAAAVGPAYQAGMTNINEFAPDPDMVDALLKKGSSTAPVQSVQEGIYRALTGGVGGFIKGRDKRQLQSQKDAYGEAVMKALMASTPTEGTVGKAERIVTPTDTRLGVTDPDMLQTELPKPPPPQSILDDPSVPDVASLGLERIETPTGPGGQIIEQQYVPGTPGTPGGLQAMVDSLRGDGTRDPGLQSALNQTALTMQYGGLQDKAAQEAARVQHLRDIRVKQAGKTPAKDPTSVQEWRFARTQGETRDYPTWLKASNISKTPSNAGETSEQQFIGKMFGKQYETIVDGAESARRQVESLDSFDAGDFASGSFAGTRLTLGRIATFFGADPEELGIGKVASGETQEAAANKLAKSMRVAGEGVMSDADLALLIASVVNLKNTPDGNKNISAVMRTLAKRSILRERMANDYLGGDGDGSMRGFSKVWQDHIDGESLFPEGYSGAVDSQLPATPGFD